MSFPESATNLERAEALLEGCRATLPSAVKIARMLDEAETRATDRAIEACQRVGNGKSDRRLSNVAYECVNVIRACARDR